MKWIKLTLNTTTAAVDLISCMLDELGVGGIEIEDHVPLSEADTKGMFIDILPDLGPDDGTARVSFYLENMSDYENLRSKIDEGLDDIARFVDVGERTLTVSETEDKDWINNWKQFFRPFTVDDILIKPTWEEIPAGMGGSLLIQIDPGTAFGTGKHETTQLCIRALREYVRPGMKVLDVGTGSGILGITALKLGAAEAFGTDLDENAVTAVGENLAANGIPAERFPVIRGNILDDVSVQDRAGYGCYDIVVANILAPVIIGLTGEVFRHMKPGALFIASGIIDTKEQDVRAAILAQPEFELLKTARQGEWVSFTARRKQA